MCKSIGLPELESVVDTAGSSLTPKTFNEMYKEMIAHYTKMLNYTTSPFTLPKFWDPNYDNDIQEPTKAEPAEEYKTTVDSKYRF